MTVAAEEPSEASTTALLRVITVPGNLLKNMVDLNVIDTMTEVQAVEEVLGTTLEVVEVEEDSVAAEVADSEVVAGIEVEVEDTDVVDTRMTFTIDPLSRIELG